MPIIGNLIQGICAVWSSAVSCYHYARNSQTKSISYMAARKHKGTKDNPWHDVVRERIRSAKIQERLIKAFDGKLELTPLQVTIGLGLYRKILPDLSATELSGEIATKPRVVSGKPMSEVDWEARYAADLAQQPPPPALPKPNGNGLGH